jgi:light-regulated signal transduction histidine kinase (bacteriophytochrome)
VRILLVEDNPNDRLLITRELKRAFAGSQIKEVLGKSDFDAEIEKGDFALSITDFQLGWINGLEVLGAIRRRYPNKPVLMFTATGSQEIAVQAMKSGLDDYILKDARYYSLIPAAAEAALKHRAEAAAHQRAQQALARSNRELERIAYIASHDLQEPVRNVLLYSQLLERRYREKIDETATQFLDYIAGGARRMQGLVTDLATYTEALEVPGNARTSADTNAVWEDEVNRLCELIAETSATVTHDPLPRINVPPPHLSRVFGHLLENALKYRNPERSLCIHLSARPQNDEWLFSLTDNGIGMLPHHTEQIFDLFRRLHRDEYPGRGLGLAICRRIVEHHNGSIWAEPRPEGGARFCFTMPAAKQESQGQAATF